MHPLKTNTFFFTAHIIDVNFYLYVIMTALAAFFALIPMALATARGSEAIAPLGRAVIGGILAGLGTTLFVVPSLYSLVVRDAAAEIRTRAGPM